MTKAIPRVEETDLLENTETGNKYIVTDMDYNDERCQLMYKLRSQRYHFNQFKISHAALTDNLTSGSYKRLDS